MYFLKQADHPQERLEERTSLPPDFPARIRKILRKKRLPKGNVYAVMPDGSYAAFKDTHKGDKVLATFLSQNMTPRGGNVTSEFADLKVAALSKLAGFADERLAQKAHRAVVKQYGLTEADGEKYWKLKSAIYQKMGGEFTHKTEKKAQLLAGSMDVEKMANAVSVALTGTSNSVVAAGLGHLGGIDGIENADLASSKLEDRAIRRMGMGGAGYGILGGVGGTLAGAIPGLIAAHEPLARGGGLLGNAVGSYLAGRSRGKHHASRVRRDADKTASLVQVMEEYATPKEASRLSMYNLLLHP
jgi:hypothetical protein